jgi:hypothetical protein
MDYPLQLDGQMIHGKAYQIQCNIDWNEHDKQYYELRLLYGEVLKRWQHEEVVWHLFD